NTRFSPTTTPKRRTWPASSRSSWATECLFLAKAGQSGTNSTKKKKRKKKKNHHPFARLTPVSHAHLRQ
ncbi:Uncharacterized protein DAT39_013474, partial [Clarias magur]